MLKYKHKILGAEMPSKQIDRQLCKAEYGEEMPKKLTELSEVELAKRI